jgi:hypothetical protein
MLSLPTIFNLKWAEKGKEKERIILGVGVAMRLFRTHPTAATFEFSNIPENT